MDPTAASTSRSAISAVRPLGDKPKDDPRVEGIADEELARHSPDGRRADRRSWSRGRLTLMTVLGLGLPLVIFGVWYWGGTESLLMGMVYVGLFMLVGYPVWYSGLIREREHNEATEIVRQTLSAEEFASRGPSPGSHGNA